jgi:tetratricopeptide (TPR) repeat protein
LQKANEAISKAIDLDPKCYQAYDLRAILRFQTKDLPGAISDCNVILGQDPEDERAFLIRGASRFYLYDFKGAGQDLDQAISLNTNDVVAYDCRGALRAKLRDWDGGVADCTKAIELNPDDANAFQNRSAIEYMQKDYEKSMDDANAVITMGTSNAAAAYCLLAHSKSHLKDRAGAMDAVNQAISLKPADASTYLQRATIKVLWDDYSGASNDISMAMQLSPTNLEIFTCRGLLELKRGETEAAMADFSHALAPDPESFHAPELHEALGYLDENLSQWRPALEEFHKGMEFKSPPNDLYFEAALIERRLGDPSAAQSELAAYVKSLPPAKAKDWPVDVAQFLAGSLAESNFLARAATSAKRPVDVPDQTSVAYYYAGMKHLLDGDKAGALARFQKCLDSQEDNNYEYFNARNELSALKNN